MANRATRTWAFTALSCAAAFGLLTALVVAAGVLPGETALLDAAMSLRSAPLTVVMQIAAFASSALPAAAICAGVTLAGIRQAGRLRPAGLWPLVGLTGATLCNIGLRLALGRLPPPVVRLGNLLPEIQAAWQKFSYPSGHAGTAVIAYGSLVAWLWLWPRLRGPAAVAAVLVCLWAGLGRVYLGLHWPSDVLGGYLLAGAWLAVGLLWRQRYNQ